MREKERKLCVIALKKRLWTVKKIGQQKTEKRKVW